MTPANGKVTLTVNVPVLGTVSTTKTLAEIQAGPAADAAADAAPTVQTKPLTGAAAAPVPRTGG